MPPASFASFAAEETRMGVLSLRRRTELTHHLATSHADRHTPDGPARTGPHRPSP